MSNHACHPCISQFLVSLPVSSTLSRPRWSALHVLESHPQDGSSIRPRVTGGIRTWSSRAERLLQYMYTKFGADSSSCFPFPFRAQTDRQTDATERPTHAGGYTAGVGNKLMTWNFYIVVWWSCRFWPGVLWNLECVPRFLWLTVADKWLKQSTYINPNPRPPPDMTHIAI